jgi:serine/threonine protein kinase
VKPGDIYQVGMTLYELLGGNLPKDGLAWLSNAQLAIHAQLQDCADKSMFIDAAMEAKICAGRILDLTSLPFVVPDGLKRILRRQSNRDPMLRSQLCSDLTADLLAIRRQTADWLDLGDSALGSFGSGSARVLSSGEEVRVEVNRGNGWRRDRSLEGDSLSGSCVIVNQRFA